MHRYGSSSAVRCFLSFAVTRQRVGDSGLPRRDMQVLYTYSTHHDRLGRSRSPTMLNVLLVMYMYMYNIHKFTCIMYHGGLAPEQDEDSSVHRMTNHSIHSMNNQLISFLTLVTARIIITFTCIFYIHSIYIVHVAHMCAEHQVQCTSIHIHVHVYTCTCSTLYLLSHEAVSRLELLLFSYVPLLLIILITVNYSNVFLLFSSPPFPH